MDIIKLTGGLGNQMFQYAYGRAREIAGDQVVFDISFYNQPKTGSYTPREFTLQKFQLDTNAPFIQRIPGAFEMYIAACKRKLGLIGEEYFQDEIYSVTIRDVLKKEFTLKSGYGKEAQSISDTIHSGHSVSLHIRRGDYVTNKQTNKFHGICDLSYYFASIAYLRQQSVSATIFIFSDDIEWAKQHFIGNEYVFVSRDGIEDVEELLLMSECEHHIIANSTFSWWAAYLNASPSKKVVMPRQWLKAHDANECGVDVPGWVQL
jgi:hypothetical protein